MSTPISNPNKLAGAYQCCMCGKGIDQGPQIELIVNCGRNRKTRVWACVEHLLGVEALKCQAIADNMRSSDYHKRLDEKRRDASRGAIRASRFASGEPKDLKDIIKHDFVPIKPVDSTKDKNGSFVMCNTLTAKLGIPKESIGGLVNKLGISILTHNGNPAIKNDDFMTLSNEVRRLAAIGRRKDGGSGVDGGMDGGIDDGDGEIEDSDDVDG